jgi:hypothetical protein
MPTTHDRDQPMSQTAARTLAKELTKETGRVHIAAAVPLGCWGGTEKGWDVFVVRGPRIPARLRNA